jgi:hypothetical protein
MRKGRVVAGVIAVSRPELSDREAAAVHLTNNIVPPGLYL